MFAGIELFVDSWTPLVNAQLDHPQKDRFEINAVEVYAYCKVRKANYNNTGHPHYLFIKIFPPSGTSGFEPRCLDYTLVQLCINKNGHCDLYTTGPTHIYCKLDNNK